MSLLRRNVLTLIALGAAIAIAPLQPSALAQDKKAAEEFIAATGDKVIAALKDGTATGASADDWFRGMLTDTLDIETMGRFTLGRYWRSATPAQRDEFLKTFEDALVKVYTRRLREYSGEEFSISGSRMEGGKDIIVTTRITSGQSGQDIDADWRVRPQSDGSFRVIDFGVGNVSLLASQRSEYASVIQRNGGSIDALIDVIRQKAEQGTSSLDPAQ
ncbi:MAG TPA: toluene tolerance protein [Rhodospirillaceae bacterium]|nr:toluene tolerance protein [Rhodospirillaceae bacterium]